MPVFRLPDDRYDFPPAWLARYDGLLCIGGGLEPERILNAYRQGIFPWFAKGDPILWWSPDPRLVLYPDRIHISRSLKKSIRKKQLHVTMDTVFEDVIEACADVRQSQGQETWLVDGMIEAYTCLFQMGYAHSVEVWSEGSLVGGLYGVSLGGVFFGESMFTRVSNASKTALVALGFQLADIGFDLIDCQVTTPHLVRMGAVEVPRKQFLMLVGRSLEKPDSLGPWRFQGFPLDSYGRSQPV